MRRSGAGSGDLWPRPRGTPRRPLACASSGVEVEVELLLREPGGGDALRDRGHPEVAEDLRHHVCLLDDGCDLHPSAALGAGEDVDMAKPASRATPHRCARFFPWSAAEAASPRRPQVLSRPAEGSSLNLICRRRRFVRRRDRRVRSGRFRPFDPHQTGVRCASAGERASCSAGPDPKSGRILSIRSARQRLCPATLGTVARRIDAACAHGSARARMPGPKQANASPRPGQQLRQ